jgi:hypothetical protein
MKPSPGYTAAFCKYAGKDAALDADETALTQAGFSVTKANNSHEWLLEGHGLRLHYWPTADRWYAFAKSWQASVSQLIRAVQAGRLVMPANARQAACRLCGAEFWWLQTDRNQKWVPVEVDGGSHFERCSGRKS